ncbi:MAG: AsmA-like C-terminal region-containing protein [Bacteroidota bacterium]
MLERTAFDWSGSDLSFGARLHLGKRRETPFSVTAKADYLNLNLLLPTLNHFGLKLPAELDSLPDDLKIRFQHTGRIRDASGIMPGYNVGELFFDDGKNQLIAGRMKYQPGPQGPSTHLHLYGDPRSVSLLFGAEKFFFEDGNFNLNLHLEGTPGTLRELMETSELRLTIDSSRVHYQPADVYVPLRQFTVDFKEKKADYFLHLRDDTTGRHLQLCGVLEDISAFLYPQAGKPFRMQTDVTAGTLYWSDLERLLQAAPSDTSSFSVRKALSTTGGVFDSFRPELNLEIDTFWAGGTNTPFTTIHAGLYIRNEDTLVLEKSGFHFGKGQLAIDATYLLDEQAHSPFALNWQTDTLSLGGLQTELAELGLELPPSLGALSGILSTQGTLTGLLDEERHLPLMDSLQGKLNFQLTDAEFKDWPALEAIGRKALMKRRFRSLRLPPLAMELTLDTGRISFPRTEIQSTALQLFVEGHYDLPNRPDLLLSIPLRNIGRGVLAVPPDTTGYAHSGWKVYLASGKDKAGNHKLKFRLGKRKYFRDRDRLEEFRTLKAKWRAERKARRVERRKRKQ